MSRSVEQGRDTPAPGVGVPVPRASVAFANRAYQAENASESRGLFPAVTTDTARPVVSVTNGSEMFGLRAIRPRSDADRLLLEAERLRSRAADYVTWVWPLIHTARYPERNR